MRGRRSLGRAAATGVMVALILVSMAPPAGAIETADFGMAPASREEAGGALRLEVPAGGGETERALRVWNKTKRPLVVQLQLVAAERGPDGTAVLGGDSPSIGWVTLSPPSVSIPARGESRVTVRIAVPADIGPGTHTFAVVAEPEPPAGQPAPAVVSRLAVAGYLEIGETAPPSNKVGAVPVVLALVALGVAISLAVRHRLVHP